jgi:hypothetical protein
MFKTVWNFDHLAFEFVSPNFIKSGAIRISDLKINLRTFLSLKCPTHNGRIEWHLNATYTSK